MGSGHLDRGARRADRRRARSIIAFDIPLTSNTERVSDIDADRGYVIALAITAVVAAPLVEEMVFRGVVMRGLRARLGAAATVTVQAVFFGAAHFDPVRGTGNIGLVMVLSAVGGAFGLGAYLLRRIGPTILAHAIFNGVVLIIVLTGANERSDFEFDVTCAPCSPSAVGVESFGRRMDTDRGTRVGHRRSWR